MNLADQCIKLFREARKSLLEAAKLLWQVREEGAFKDKYETFTEYVEQGVGVSRGYASKLLTAYQFYCIEGGVSHEKLAKVDVEKLYQAISLTGTPDEKLSKALTLTRREIKEELGDEDGHVCEPVTITWCKICNKRLEDK